ncbi:MAG: ricin-type beta-trefoil lectin domain protein [Polaromonas sp.]
MKALHRTLFSLAAVAGFCLPLAAQAEVFASAGTFGSCLTNAGGTPAAQGCVSGASNQKVDMPFVAGNAFYGQLKIDGKCLDASGTALAFAACKSGDAQIWKLDGNTGKINNGSNNCVLASGGTVKTVNCGQGGTGLTWWSQGSTKVKIIAVAGMKTVAAGTKLTVSNGNFMNGNQIVAGGAGNIVAGGAGNIVAGGAGNIVAGGAGN